MDCIAYYYWEAYRLRGIYCCVSCGIQLGEADRFEGANFVVIEGRDS